MTTEYRCVKCSTGTCNNRWHASGERRTCPYQVECDPDLMLRVVCVACGLVKRVPAVPSTLWDWPTCCGRDVLIAGEAKFDMHGLSTERIVDPAYKFDRCAVTAPSKTTEYRVGHG